MPTTAAAAPATFADATYRKIGWRIVPYIALLYVIAFLDRVNVSYAKLQMSSDLGFSESVYGLGAGLFFIGYFFLEIPSNFALARFGARIWIARILVIWGFISAAFMYVETPTQFYALRFLLGVGEAGFFPGVILYLTYWFPAQRRAQMTALFMSAIAVSGVIGGPMSGWIMQSMAGLHGLKGWQWLFLVEALPAVVFGVVTYFYLDDTPAKAKWLSQDEIDLVTRDLAAEVEAKGTAGGHAKFGDSVRDSRIWTLVAIYFCQIVGFYGVSFFLPQIIKDIGVTDLVTNGFITAIPWGVAAVVMVVNARHSDRMLERRWHIAIPALVSGLGLTITAALGTGHTVLSIAVLTVTCAASLCISPVFWSLTTSIVSGAAAAGSIALINSFGALGGFVGPYLVGVLKDWTGHPTHALYGLVAFYIGAATLVLVVFNRRTAS